MRLLGFIEIGHSDTRPPARICGCGRPAVGDSVHCTRCRNAVQADRKAAAKSGKISHGPCPTGCGGTVRNGSCPTAGCSVGVKSSRR